MVESLFPVIFRPFPFRSSVLSLFLFTTHIRSMALHDQEVAFFTGRMSNPSPTSAGVPECASAKSIILVWKQSMCIQRPQHDTSSAHCTSFLFIVTLHIHSGGS